MRLGRGRRYPEEQGLQNREDPHAPWPAQPEQTAQSLQNGTGVTFLITLLGGENKPQQSLHEPHSGHRDTSTGPRGGSGPVSSHLASPAPRVCPGRAARRHTCLPNCEHRGQSQEPLAESARSPGGARHPGMPLPTLAAQEPEEDSCLSPLAGTRAVAHGGRLAGAPQGTSRPPKAGGAPVWTALLSAAAHGARRGAGLPQPPTVRAEG